MDFESILAQLKFREVTAPPPPGWWPPAIGWWLLAGLVLTVVIIGCWQLIRWRRRTAWRRAALKELRQLRSTYLQTPSPTPAAQILTQISVLLKRCAATATNNPRLLSSTGAEWRAALVEPSGILLTEDLELLGDGHYQANPRPLDPAALQRIENWIKGLSR